MYILWTSNVSYKQNFKRENLQSEKFFVVVSFFMQHQQRMWRKAQKFNLSGVDVSQRQPKKNVASDVFPICWEIV